MNPADRVFVSGADGFIGSHLVEQIVRQGSRVKAFVYYNSNGSWGWLDDCPADIRNEIEIYPGDIRDYHSVRQGMTGCDVVFHLAALISIPYSYRSPESYIETNVKGTLNIVQAARELQIKKVIHTSTSEVYGTAQFVPITEEHPIHPQSPYAASKAGADHLAMSYHHSFQVPVTIVRPFNTYGPRQSARAIIPTVITQIAGGSRKLQLGALEPTRDFNYIQNTVGGFIAAARSDQAVGEVFNIGSHYEISIGETVRLISEIMNVEIEIVQDPGRLRPATSEVQRLLADRRKAKKLLGWEPVYSGKDGLRRGIEETIAWFCDPINLNKYKPDLYQV